MRWDWTSSRAGKGFEQGRRGDMRCDNTWWGWTGKVFMSEYPGTGWCMWKRYISKLKIKWSESSYKVLTKFLCTSSTLIHQLKCIGRIHAIMNEGEQGEGLTRSQAHSPHTAVFQIWIVRLRAHALKNLNSKFLRRWCWWGLNVLKKFVC